MTGADSDTKIANHRVIAKHPFPPFTGTEVSESAKFLPLELPEIAVPAPAPTGPLRSENGGLISTDRGTKTTLVRTIPRSF